MGGLRWWISASSAEEITSTFAAIEVIDDPETIRWAGAENLTSLSDPWLAAHEIGEQDFADAWRRAAGPE